MAGIVILGFPRSGTTLLRRLLGAHPDLVAPPETGLLAAAARFLREETILGGTPVGVLSGLALAGLDEAEVLERTRAFALGFLDDIARARGRSRWVEKHPYDVFHLDAVERLLGDAVHYVALVRHGADVVPSVMELVDQTDRYLDGLHAYVARNPRPRLAVAEAWRDCTERLLRFVEERPTAILVRYEELVEDPAAVLRTLGAHLDLVFAEDAVERALARPPDPGFGDWKTYARATVDASSAGRHRELPRGLRWELGRILNPTLEACGYPPLTGRPPGDRAAALRRHQLALIAQGLRAGARGAEDPGGEPEEAPEPGET